MNSCYFYTFCSIAKFASRLKTLERAFEDLENFCTQASASYETLLAHIGRVSFRILYEAGQIRVHRILGGAWLLISWKGMLVV